MSSFEKTALIVNEIGTGGEIHANNMLNQYLADQRFEPYFEFVNWMSEDKDFYFPRSAAENLRKGMLGLDTFLKQATETNVIITDFFTENSINVTGEILSVIDALDHDELLLTGNLSTLAIVGPFAKQRANELDKQIQFAMIDQVYMPNPNETNPNAVSGQSPLPTVFPNFIHNKLFPNVLDKGIYGEVRKKVASELGILQLPTDNFQSIQKQIGKYILTANDALIPEGGYKATEVTGYLTSLEDDYKENTMEVIEDLEEVCGSGKMMPLFINYGVMNSIVSKEDGAIITKNIIESLPENVYAVFGGVDEMEAENYGMFDHPQVKIARGYTNHSKIIKKIGEFGGCVLSAASSGILNQALDGGSGFIALKDFKGIQPFDWARNVDSVRHKGLIVPDVSVKTGMNNLREVLIEMTQLKNDSVQTNLRNQFAVKEGFDPYQNIVDALFD